MKNDGPSHVGSAAPWSPDEANSVIFWRPPLEERVLRREQRRIHALLGLAEALRDHVAEVVVDRVLRGAEDVGVVVRLRQRRGRSSRPGAIAWAHSTSSVISPAQPTRFGVALVERREAVRRDDVERRVRQAEHGVERCRSWAIVGLWKASTITIVRPVPSMPREYSGVKS